ncbi:MAG: TonB-dependent receptor [Alphaproteobacteria bacterium]
MLRLFSHLSAIGGLCLACWPVLAQEPVAGDAGVQPAPKAPDEIVVTAMKREAAIQDVGAAITAIGGEDVKLKNIESGSDLQFHVPNLVFSQIGGTAQYTIRGVGLGVDSGLAEPGVAVHIDGAFIPRATQTLVLTGDIQRLEVLRGPQGTLYGRNATGGVINFITNAPQDDFGMGASVGGAGFGEIVANGYVTGPIGSPKARARLYADYKTFDGHTENLTTGETTGDQKRLNVRFNTQFDVTDDFTVGLTSRFSRMRNKVSSGQVVDDTTGLFTDLGTVTTEPYKSLADGSGPTFQDVAGVTLTLAYQGSGFDVRTITSWIHEDFERNTDIDGSSLGTFKARNLQKSEAWSQEINVSGTGFGGRLSWIAGGFGFTEDAQLYSRNRGAQMLDDLEQALLGQVGLPISVNDILDMVRDRSIIALNVEENQSLGAFGDLTYELTDGLRLIGGLRFSWDKKTSAASFHNAQADCAATHTLTSRAVNPKVAVEWDATDDIMAYAQVQQGIKPGGVGIGDSTCSNVFQPEEITSIEVGVKTNWWDDRLTANLTGFSYYYDNYQAFQIVGLAAITENARHARVDGLEAEFVAKPFEFLALNFNATYMDARFTDYESTDPMATGIGRVFLGISPDPQDLSGNALVRSPKYTLSGGVQVMFPLPFVPLFDGGLARLDGYWSDEILFRPYAEAFDVRPSYSVLNGTVAIFSEDQVLRLRAYVKNITGEEYVESKFMVPISALALGSYGAPRTFGAVLNVSF